MYVVCISILAVGDMITSSYMIGLHASSHVHVCVSSWALEVSCGVIPPQPLDQGLHGQRKNMLTSPRGLHCRVTDGVFNVVWIYATFDIMNATTKKYCKIFALFIQDLARSVHANYQVARIKQTR